jgi:hypothetical protein
MILQFALCVVILCCAATAYVIATIGPYPAGDDE